ncbi:OmpA family protein [Pseudooceanicola nanhaiensis]|uniref:OmpA family protein n=1 Tax=Pseudooceanicola nanhaiensis TaxID=375761 RepID=UPI001CD2007E|nr:OmpA family protein [Pseudooceanicola nanhaiensis]MCA0922138.1 OmpA family protein [Pseudooceanicola nanhaiensis]
MAQDPCGAVVYFPNDVSALNSDVQTAVQQVMAQAPTATVDVTGYADAVGAASYNAVLSGKRATNVANYIKEVAPGATINQVIAGGEIAGTGSNPVDRRVEIRLPGCTAAAPLPGGLSAATMAALAAGAAVIILLTDDDSSDTTTTTTTTTGATGS